MSASNPALLTTGLKETDLRFPKRQDKEDFLYGIKNRAPTMADAEVGHRSCSVCQIGHVAIQRGCPLQWDPDTERFADDAEANRMLHRPYRAPWDLNIEI